MNKIVEDTQVSEANVLGRGGQGKQEGEGKKTRSPKMNRKKDPNKLVKYV